MQANKRGKVRDIYNISDDKLIIAATDKISAFDVVLPKLVEGKGKILTAMSLFWFDFTKEIIPNHIISSEITKMPVYFQKPEFEGRVLLVKKLKILPFECIVRGYAFGSFYEEGGKYQLAEKLPSPIFTPSTKAAEGHDENIPFEEMESALGTKLANEIKQTSLKLYNACYNHAYDKGIIIADSKFEFGLDENNNLILADEIFTPDSSRFWSAADYKTGISPKSYDKQLLRDWLLENNKQFDNVPDEILSKTADIYAECLAYIWRF